MGRTPRDLLNGINLQLQAMVHFVKIHDSLLNISTAKDRLVITTVLGRSSTERSPGLFI